MAVGRGSQPLRPAASHTPAGRRALVSVPIVGREESPAPLPPHGEEARPEGSRIRQVLPAQDPSPPAPQSNQSAMSATAHWASESNRSTTAIHATGCVEQDFRSGVSPNPPAPQFLHSRMASAASALGRLATILTTAGPAVSRAGKCAKHEGAATPRAFPTHLARAPTRPCPKHATW